MAASRPVPAIEAPRALRRKRWRVQNIRKLRKCSQVRLSVRLHLGGCGRRSPANWLSVTTAAPTCWFQANLVVEFAQRRVDGCLVIANGLTARQVSPLNRPKGVLRPPCRNKSFGQFAHHLYEVGLTLEPNAGQLGHVDVTVDHLHTVRGASMGLEQVRIALVAAKAHASGDVE